MLEHHARQRPTGPDEGVHDMLANPFLGFELDPLLPDGTPDGPLALPTPTSAAQAGRASSGQRARGSEAVEWFTLRKCNGRALHWGTLNHNLMENPTVFLIFPATSWPTRRRTP